VYAKALKTSPPYTRLRAYENVQLTKPEARELVEEINSLLSVIRIRKMPMAEQLANLLQMELDLEK
jgi:hypothetical protein